jgi:hypothetical protein
LVERYGCIAGYLDSTFRSNQTATRHELAAALNACLDQISDRFATKEDLETVKALQDVFIGPFSRKVLRVATNNTLSLGDRILYTFTQLYYVRLYPSNV